MKKTGKPGERDADLVESIFHSGFNIIRKFCGDSECTEIICESHSNPSIWEEYGFKRQLIDLTVDEEIINRKTREKGYSLSDPSLRDIIELGDDLLEAKHPCVLIFASCFSLYRQVLILSTFYYKLEKSLLN